MKILDAITQREGAEEQILAATLRILHALDDRGALVCGVSRQSVRWVVNYDRGVADRCGDQVMFHLCVYIAGGDTPHPESLMVPAALVDDPSPAAFDEFAAARKRAWAEEHRQRDLALSSEIRKKEQAELRRLLLKYPADVCRDERIIKARGRTQ